MRHLIDFGDLTRAEWESLYQRCSDIMDHPADFMDASCFAPPPPFLGPPAVGG